MLITAAQAAKELLVHENIMLIAHASPDGDTLGGCFALYYGLTAMGKRVKIRCSDDLPVRFSYLYRDYADLDFQEEYVVAIDVAALQLIGEKLSAYQERVDLCIDHHPSNGLYAAKTFLDQHAAATCELVYEILVYLSAELTPLVANCLYTGIATDTGCFRYSNTSVNTHTVAARLFERGAEYEEINRFLFDTKSKSRLAIEQQVLGTVEFFSQDRIAMICITQQMIAASHADEAELDGVSSLPRTIEGVEVGITLRERADGAYKISVRTCNRADASEICKCFGGGGHKRAAGCLIFEDFATVRTKIVETAEREIGNRGAV